jgi:predicted nucleic acid-binding protein
MKAFLDTSVLVAVFYGDHVHHAATTLTLPQIAARLHAGTWKSLNAKLHRWRKINEFPAARSRL